MMTDPTTGADALPLIKASELAEFGFCERAWWLSNIKQVARQNQQHLVRGQKVHSRHEQQVQAASWWGWISMGLLGAGVIVLLFALGLAMV